ncbi:FMN-dependent NADH-azoreductase [Lactococcus raffinolactis]|nr:FMN-dependent NADH-azoreductase [Lactococcus raffinolactis]QIW57117.1 FMN-dependent NADH-azoreductase [Lactococcus raffinolactis]
MDNILIANKTFRYTETGSEGLMTDNYKVLYLQSSGGIYTENDRYTPLEFSHYFLKEMFVNIMSFDNYYIVRAQGTNISPVDSQNIMNQVENDLSTIFEDFYTN